MQKTSIDKRSFWSLVFSHAYLWLLLVVLYAPIAVIIICSFTESKVLGNWTGFSVGLYTNLFSGQAGHSLNMAIINTAIIAVSSAFLATILGTIAAIGIYNMRARHRKMVLFLNQIPMINPDIHLARSASRSPRRWTSSSTSRAFPTAAARLWPLPRLRA